MFLEFLVLEVVNMTRTNPLHRLFTTALTAGGASVVALVLPSIAHAQAPIEGNYTLDEFNPLHIAQSPLADELSTPRGILSQVLAYAFPLAGLILFVMLVWGGFEILSGATTKKSLDAGKQRITSAIVGFLLLFSSYWIMRVVEIIFGVNIF